MKRHWNELAKARMKEIGVTQEQLAEMLGKTQGAIAHWLNKRREPSISDIANIMKALKLESLVLDSEGYVEYSADSISNVIPVVGVDTEYKSDFPVISSVAAGMWAEAVEPYQIEEIDTYLPTTERVSERSFWLEVQGDSMTSAAGISFPSGTMILVDPEIEPESGKLVVAKLTDVNEATFKQLIIDAGQKFLKPLNPSYPIMPINGNCKIIGVVKDAKLKLF
ncbi:LexA family transcriptional regulator [Photobacterium sp. R1]